MTSNLGQHTWHRIHEILDAALDLPHSERDTFVHDACKGDAQLEKEVHSLIAMERVATEEFPLLQDSDRGLIKPGLRLGSYRLLKLLGHGGFGQAWLAERPSDGHRAAVKILSPSYANTRVLRRFQREQRVLSRLDHPGIASLLSAGQSEDGLHYLVMTFIQGMHIDVFCRTRRLKLSQRLELLQKVCEIVDFAHRQGIVHRDIKPSNIMVTPDGAPVLLDFGIAHGATDDGDTKTGFLALTPSFASPEHARGEPTGIAADVYSLGALAYSLLTARLPLQMGKMDLMGVAEFVSKKQPEPPSTYLSFPEHMQAVGAELDQVILTALAKEPYHRQENATVLGAQLLHAGTQMGTLSLDSSPRILICAMMEQQEEAQGFADVCRQQEYETNLLLLEDRFSQAKLVEQELARHDHCFVAASGGKLQPWHNLAFSAYLRERVPLGGLNLITGVLARDHRPKQEMRLPKILRNRYWVDLSNPGLGQRLSNLLRGERQETRPRGMGVCPFQGLAVFTEAESRFFFGREALVDTFVDHLEENKVLVVLGPSGSGKSSAVQAGLLPILRERGVEIHLMTPGRRPLKELAYCFADTEDEHHDLEQMSALMISANSFLHHLINIHQTESPLVLVIDQFEEIFTLVEDPRERESLLANLSYALEEQQRPFSLILTMRSDFIGHCAAHEDLNNFVNAFMIQVGGMNRDDLRRAVTAPARLAGLEFEDGLVDRILDDVARAQTELPLLEHALLELYRHRENFWLTNKAYQDIGGIEGALAQRAEAEYQALDGDHQQMLRRMFSLCLVQPGDGAEDTRRRADQTEVLAVCGDDRKGRRLIDQWVDARLLTSQFDPVRRLKTIDVAHEALMRRWERIRLWMNEDRSTARRLNDLRQAASVWDSEARDKGHLPNSGQLVRFLELRDDRGEIIGTLETEYLDAAVTERRIQEQVREDQFQRELEASKTLALRARQLTALSVLVLLVIAVFSWSSYRKEIQSRYDLAVELVRKGHLVNQSRVSVESLVYAQRAIETMPASYNLEPLLLHQDEIAARLKPRRVVDLERLLMGGEVSADGSRIFVTTTNGTVSAVAIPSGKLLWRTETKGLGYGLTLSPSGRELLVFDMLQNIHRLDTETGEILEHIELATGIMNVSYLDESRILLSQGGFTGTHVVIDLKTKVQGNPFLTQDNQVRPAVNRQSGLVVVGRQDGKIINMADGSLLGEIPADYGLGDFFISDGGGVVFRSDQGVFVFNRKGVLQQTLASAPAHVEMLRDDRILLQQGGRLEVVDLETGTRIPLGAEHRFASALYLPHAGEILAVSLSNQIHRYGLDGGQRNISDNPWTQPNVISLGLKPQDQSHVGRDVVALLTEREWRFWDPVANAYLTEPLAKPDHARTDAFYFTADKRDWFYGYRELLFMHSLNPVVDPRVHRLDVGPAEFIVGNGWDRILQVFGYKRMVFYSAPDLEVIQEVAFDQSIRHMSFTPEAGQIDLITPDFKIVGYDYNGNRIYEPIPVPQDTSEVFTSSAGKVYAQSGNRLLALGSPITGMKHKPEVVYSDDSPIVVTGINRYMAIIYSYGRQQLEMIDLRDGSVGNTYPAERHPWAIKVSPDGTQIVLGSGSTSFTQWAAKDLSLIREVDHGVVWPSFASYSYDGDWLLLNNQASYQVMDARTGAMLQDLPLGVGQAMFNTDKSGLRVWDAREQQVYSYSLEHNARLGVPQSLNARGLFNAWFVFGHNYTAAMDAQRLSLIEHGADLDMPMSLRALQTRFLSYGTLHYQAPEGVAKESYSHLEQAYIKASEAHLAECAHPKFNVYKHFYRPLLKPE